MENFTTAEHRRNTEGNVVVESTGKTISRMREEQKNRNFINGVIISAMALTVVLTGTMLGATTAHNQNLRAEIESMQAEKEAYMSSIQATQDNTNTGIDTTNNSWDKMNNTTSTGTNNTSGTNTTTDTNTINRNRTSYGNYTGDFTTKDYINRYYAPHTRNRNYISKEDNPPVDLPTISAPTRHPATTVSAPANINHNETPQQDSTHRGRYNHTVKTL